MTNTTGAPTPAGWYPVSPGSSQLRWWDGSAWTEHVHDQSVQQPGGGIETAPEGTNPNTPWIWILALLPFASLISLVTVNFRVYLTDIEQAGRSGAADPTLVYRAMADSGYFSIFILAFAVYVVAVVLAALDWRALRSRGVVRPFHWALTFIPGGWGYLVYMIGRFVVVKRRTGRGLAPLWVWIAAIVITAVIASVWAFSIVGGVISDLPLSNS